MTDNYDTKYIILVSACWVPFVLLNALLENYLRRRYYFNRPEFKMVTKTKRHESCIFISQFYIASCFILILIPLLFILSVWKNRLVTEIFARISVVWYGAFILYDTLSRTSLNLSTTIHHVSNLACVLFMSLRPWSLLLQTDNTLSESLPLCLEPLLLLGSGYFSMTLYPAYFLGMSKITFKINELKELQLKAIYNMQISIFIVISSQIYWIIWAFILENYVEGIIYAVCFMIWNFQDYQYYRFITNFDFERIQRHAGGLN